MLFLFCKLSMKINSLPQCQTMLYGNSPRSPHRLLPRPLVHLAWSHASYLPPKRVLPAAVWLSFAGSLPSFIFHLLNLKYHLIILRLNYHVF